jgi:hypothetical protein
MVIKPIRSLFLGQGQFHALFHHLLAHSKATTCFTKQATPLPWFLIFNTETAKT